MEDSSKHILQLCHLGSASASQARGVLRHCEQLAARAGQEFRVSAVFIATRRRPADALVELARSLDFDVHVVVQRGPVDPGVWWQLRRLMRRLDASLVHAHDSRSYRLALFLQPLCGYRMVATATNDSAEDWRKWLAREVDHKLLPGFDRVIAANNELAWQLSQLGCRVKQIDVIGTGIDTEAFSRDTVTGHLREQLKIDPSAGVIGAHATSDETHARLIFDAVQIAEATLGPLHLIAVGDESGAPSITRLAAVHGRSERTHWFSTSEDRAEHYGAMDVFVAGAGVGGPSVELLEAQSMEVPVVGVGSAKTRSWIEPDTTGILIDAGRADLLAQAFVRLLRDRHEARIMASAARLRICQRFRAGDRFERLAASYRRAIESA